MKRWVTGFCLLLAACGKEGTETSAPTETQSPVFESEMDYTEYLKTAADTFYSEYGLVLDVDPNESDPTEIVPAIKKLESVIHHPSLRDKNFNKIGFGPKNIRTDDSAIVVLRTTARPQEMLAFLSSQRTKAEEEKYRAEQARLEAERKAEQDRLEAERKKEQQRLAAEKQAQLAIEAQRKAEQDRLAREAAEREAARLREEAEARRRNDNKERSRPR